MKGLSWISKLMMGALIIFISQNAIGQSNQHPPRDKKPPKVEEIFKKMDANKDGQLSEQEVRGPLKERFASIDTNDDGMISKKELRKAPKPKRRERPDEN